GGQLRPPRRAARGAEGRRPQTGTHETRRPLMTTAGTLSVTLPTDREVLLTRTFEAPRALVFDAWTRPELLRRWYGPSGWSLAVCEVDLKVGGAWHYVLRRPDGRTVGQRGVYSEIVPGERLVNTETWDDWDAGETLVTTEFVEQQGRTLLTSRILFPSKDVRDTVVQNG